MASSFRPVTLITGASAGIGEALARVFAAHGHELMITARDEQRLNGLADRIGAGGMTRPHVVAADLGRLDAPARLAHELLSRGIEPAYVVNNAGFGLAGSADELDRAEQLDMVEVNIRAVTDLSLRWVESLVRHKGGILNVASVAGFLAAPGMAVYYASKAYVLNFSEALHVELAAKGIRVTALCPGPVPTNFQRRAGLKSLPIERLLRQSPDAVAAAGYEGLMAGRRLVVPGLGNKLIVSLVPRLLPRRVTLAVTDARSRRRRDGPARWTR